MTIKTTVTRIVKLETAAGSGRSGGLLIAADRAEADRLAQESPRALVILTGVPR